MTELEEIRDRIAAIELVEEVDSVLELNKDEIVRILWEQLAEGKSGFGATTLDGSLFYKASTILRKLQKDGLSSAIDRITLFDTGDFYFSIYLQIREEEFIFKSDIYYAPDILSRTGDSIYILNEESLLILRDTIILPALQEQINNSLNGI